MTEYDLRLHEEAMLLALEDEKGTTNDPGPERRVVERIRTALFGDGEAARAAIQAAQAAVAAGVAATSAAT